MKFGEICLTSKNFTFRQRHSSLSSDRAVELEEEVSRLRSEQRRLEEANEELQAQIFAASVAEGRSLLMAPPAGSLAEEMESMSKDQVKKCHEIHKFDANLLTCF